MQPNIINVFAVSFDASVMSKCVSAAAGELLGGVRSRSGRAGGRGGVSADLHLSARLGFTKAQRVPGVADGHADRSAGEEQPQRESDTDGL